MSLGSGSIAVRICVQSAPAKRKQRAKAGTRRSATFGAMATRQDLPCGTQDENKEPGASQRLKVSAGPAPPVLAAGHRRGLRWTSQCPAKRPLPAMP